MSNSTLSETCRNDKTFHLRNAYFDYQNRLIVAASGNFYLTKKEADVLFLLCCLSPSIVTYSKLEDYAWKGTYASLQSIAQVIRRIRMKLKDENKSIIITHPKYGYSVELNDKKEIADYSNPIKSAVYAWGVSSFNCSFCQCNQVRKNVR